MLVLCEGCCDFQTALELHIQSGAESIPFLFEKNCISLWIPCDNETRHLEMSL